jgi:Ulp1 family protease
MFVDFRAKHIGYFDPLRGHSGDTDAVRMVCLETLFKYIKEAWMHKMGRSGVPVRKDWNLIHHINIPQQTGNTECGVLMCATVDLLAHGTRPGRDSYSMRDTPYFRAQLTEILSSGVYQPLRPLQWTKTEPRISYQPKVPYVGKK